MNIVILKHPKQHVALVSFIDQIASDFIELGHSVTVLSLTGDGWHLRLLETLKKNDIDFVLSFNGFALDILKAEFKFGLEQENHSLTYNIYEFFNLVFVALLIDHPCYFIPNRLKQQINHLIVTCVDKSNLNFLSYLYSEERIKVKSFLPQAGTAYNNFRFEDFDDYLRKRTIPILFVGHTIHEVPGYEENDYALERYWAGYDKEIVGILQDTADYVLRHDSILPLEDAYNYVLKQRGIILNQFPKETQEDFYFGMHLIDRYVRAHRRYAFLEAVGKAGIPLILHSDGWEKYLSKYKSITFKNSLSYEEGLSYLQKTRLYINTTSLTYGAQERVFNAMLNGAVAVTADNDFYKNEGFIDGEDIILYKWSKLDDLMNRLALLLESPETTWKIAKSAQEKADTKHRWKNRAQEILRLVTEYKNKQI